jgi:hypothetical protein
MTVFKHQIVFILGWFIPVVFTITIIIIIIIIIIIVLPLNTTLFLKDKNSYMFRLVKVAVTKIRTKVYRHSLQFEISCCRLQHHIWKSTVRLNTTSDQEWPILDMNRS